MPRVTSPATFSADVAPGADHIDRIIDSVRRYHGIVSGEPLEGISTSYQPATGRMTIALRFLGYIDDDVYEKRTRCLYVNPDGCIEHVATVDGWE